MAQPVRQAGPCLGSIGPGWTADPKKTAGNRNGCRSEGIAGIIVLDVAPPARRALPGAAGRRALSWRRRAVVWPRISAAGSFPLEFQTAEFGESLSHSVVTTGMERILAQAGDEKAPARSPRRH